MANPFQSALLIVLAACPALAAEPPFAVAVVDGATGSPVPLVELETVHGLRWVTDNTGAAAIDAPELVGEGVFFHVRSHGYEVPADGFGYRGMRLEVKPGKVARLELRRTMIAERVRRLTGAGLAGERAKLEGRVDPVQSQVIGCDSVQNAIYGGRLFWIWGDTNRLAYPLGNFHTTAATSDLKDREPEFRFFENDEGFVKGVAPIPGDGPTWLSALATLEDAGGKEHLVATYVKIKPPLEVYERGLCEFDPEKEVFERVAVIDAKTKLYPDGHAFRHTVDGEAWLYFGEATPTMRIPDRYEAWIDPSSYQRVEAKGEFRDPEGKPVKAHRGSVAWNSYRKRWVSVFCEQGGSNSYLGEIWYAEAPAPDGPWGAAVKVLTHDHYSFYNPSQHPWWSDGRHLYFEGTFTKTFSKAKRAVPRYDYNQLLYRIDLDDPRLEPAR